MAEEELFGASSAMALRNVGRRGVFFEAKAKRVLLTRRGRMFFSFGYGYSILFFSCVFFLQGPCR